MRTCPQEVRWLARRAFRRRAPSGQAPAPSANHQSSFCEHKRALCLHLPMVIVRLLELARACVSVCAYKMLIQRDNIRALSERKLTLAGHLWWRTPMEKSAATTTTTTMVSERRRVLLLLLLMLLLMPLNKMMLMMLMLRDANLERLAGKQLAWTNSRAKLDRTGPAETCMAMQMLVSRYDARGSPTVLK